MVFINLAFTAATYMLYLAAPLFVLYISYSLVSHPLRRYPGPFLAKITDAYSGYFAYKKELHLVAYEHMRRYGNVYRLGPDKLIFNSSVAVQDIYLNPRVAKGESYNHGMFAAKNRNLIMTTDRDDHRKKMKVIGAVLNERSMRIFQPKMISRINEFLQQILNSTSQSSTSINVLDISTYLATDVAGDLAFGHPLNTQTDETNRYFPATLQNWSWRINVMMQFPPLRIYNLIMMTLRYKETMKLGTAIKDIIRTREAMD
ncbi:hypothetical protein QQS21_011025, partial [Conoideocrella luteorostrata]